MIDAPGVAALLLLLLLILLSCCCSCCCCSNPAGTAATAAYLQRHWKTILALVAAGLLLLGVGIIAGYSIGRQSSNRSNTPAGSYNSQSSSGSSSSIGRSSRDAPGVVRGAALLADGQSLQQLPAPASDEAKQVISQPGTPGECWCMVKAVQSNLRTARLTVSV
jgi:hypothetical protein